MTDNLFRNVISPWKEMHAWETLWGMRKQTEKTLADLFRETAASLPSQALEFVKSHELFPDTDLESQVFNFLRGISERFSVCVNSTFHYPRSLQRAKHPVELFYYKGDIGVLESRCVSIVGSRESSLDGKNRAARLARELVAHDFTIVSGLAKGIDTAAMSAAIEENGRTVGVIGTPLTESYPRENASLQECIASNHLLLSQVPFYRYQHQPWNTRKYYFPQRNATMAALSEATVIVEAGETSGTLTQARACMQQGRKLFILNSCFESGLKWPHTYAERGAIRVRSTDDILSVLRDPSDDDEPTMAED